jgi:hypothetical protein
MTPSGIEPATFQLGLQCLKQLRQRGIFTPGLFLLQIEQKYA